MARRNYTLYGEFLLNIDDAIKSAKSVTQQLEKGVAGVGKEAQKATASFGGLGRIITAATVIGWAFEAQYAVRELTSATIRYGAELDHVRSGTEQLSESTGLALGQMAEELRRSSDYTLTLNEAMRQVNQSLLLGGEGAAIVKNLGTLFDIARFNARAMGIDVQRALESMVTGLGRVSPRWLDNLGVIIDTRREYTAWAEANDRMVSSLTEGEQRLILINAIIEKYGSLMEGAGEQSRTAAEDFEALASSFQTLLGQIGETILENKVVSGLLDALIDAIAYSTEWNELTKEQEETWVALSAGVAKFQKDQERAIGRSFTRAMGDDVKRSKRLMNEFNVAFDNLITGQGELQDVVDAYNAWADAIEKLNGTRPGALAVEMSALVSAMTPGGGESMLGISGAIAQANEQAMKNQRDAFEAAKETIKQYQSRIDSTRLSLIRSGKNISDVTEVTEAYKEIFDSLLSDPEFLSADAETQLAILEEGIYLLNQELEKFKETAEKPIKIKLEISEGTKLLQDYERAISNLVERGLPIQDALTMLDLGKDFASYINTANFNPNMVEVLLLMRSVLGRMERQAEGLIPPTAEEQARAAAQAAREAQRAYEEWRSALESDIESAVLSDLEVTKDDFLPGRKDSPLEAVRRLRDIVNLGLQSPWAEFFEIPPEVLAEGEEAVKRWAYDLSERGAELRDISLIDKDAFLRELEDLKNARQERAAVMEQLINWAIEAGLADNEKEATSLAKDYLGIPSAEGLQEGLEGEIKDYKFADYVTGAFNSDLEKNSGKYSNSGRDMANAMFTGWEAQMNENISNYQYSPPEGEPPDPSGAVPTGRGPLR